MDLNELKVLLDKHDWYFEKSDDLRVYRAGLKEKNTIKEELLKLSLIEALKLVQPYIEKYKIENFKQYIKHYNN